MNKQFKLVIGITGRMRAGKSTVAKFLSESLDIPIVSFGGYLVNYAQTNNLQPTRDLLQEIGNAMVQQDADNFVQKVFRYANIVCEFAIVEGIRHQSVLRALQNITDIVLMIYIDVDQRIRYERFCSGQKISDSAISFQEFIEKDNHPVESEIESLKPHSEIISASDDHSNELILLQLYGLLPSLNESVKRTVSGDSFEAV